MKIQILGTGCPKCNQLEQAARTAIKELGDKHEIEKITDINEIISFGVMMTPALALDGEVKSVGKILTSDEIKQLIK
ncbi:MAG: thioredoxin family protein [Myxococcota bacterium]